MTENQKWVYMWGVILVPILLLALAAAVLITRDPNEYPVHARHQTECMCRRGVSR